MMIEPPIDEMVKIVDGNKYKLCCLMAKRAKYLSRTIPEQLETSDKKEISIAADEIYRQDVISSDSSVSPKTTISVD